MLSLHTAAQTNKYSGVIKLSDSQWGVIIECVYGRRRQRLIHVELVLPALLVVEEAATLWNVIHADLHVVAGCFDF